MTGRPSSADFTRYTDRSYEEALNTVLEVGKRHGFRIPHVHDLAASIRQGGFEREPYGVVELCRADIAYGVLSREPRFGALMPCRIAIYPENGRTALTTILPSHFLDFFAADPAVRAAAEQVDDLLKAIIEESSLPES